ncbi:DUF1289 domain-containing protein [Solimicrobium silvestre]|uniref:Fe-S protein n=1 Tax=Solimicrobium silvestre TaxID=2099400 RepID=A0A2S9GUW5_9BURK|nr:DUF1289 domain-containing protein [Solimicrobium silvestre]PRC91503.1 hypothetical protein S2091_3781 [Solimicrobium silvestre]
MNESILQVSLNAQQTNVPPRADTPCVAVCSTTFDEICRGCGRTVVEVATWVVMDEAEKELVWQRILSQGYPRRNG